MKAQNTNTDAGQIGFILFSSKKPIHNQKIIYWEGGEKEGIYDAINDHVIGRYKLPKYWKPLPVNTDTQIQDAKKWWAGITNATLITEISEKYFPSKVWVDLTDSEILSIYLKEVQPEVKEEIKNPFYKGYKEEDTVFAKWFWNSIDGDNAICDDNGFVLEAPNEVTGKRIVQCVNGWDKLVKDMEAFKIAHNNEAQYSSLLKDENDHLKERNDTLKEALDNLLLASSGTYNYLQENGTEAAYLKNCIDEAKAAIEANNI